MQGKNNKSAQLIQKVNDLPRLPGVYLYKDEKSAIIYVGKAKSLRDRVKSYFVVDLQQGTKTAALVSQIVDLDFIEVTSELEALILEAELIKKYKPKYNIALKDDKSALYIVIRNERVKIQNKITKLPTVLTARETELKKDDIIFGPYPHSQVAKFVIRAIRKMIPYRDCSVSKFQRYEKLERPCFYGHIGLCSAPCTNKTTPESYKKDIKKIEKLLAGESPQVIKTLENEMKKYSKDLNFEEAAKTRDLLTKIKYVNKKFRDPNEFINNPYLVDDLIDQALDSLVKNISYLQKVPARIECYDISNISGKEATGSMVVATNGRINTKEYRKFRIKFKTSPDDFDMMREVLTRRFKNDWPTPDLLVVDGGKGQVSAALDVLTKFNLGIPLIGLAKKHEKIVLHDFSEINLDKDDEGLKLLQRLRDEAHRFAKTYHLKLRLKKVI